MKSKTLGIVQLALSIVVFIIFHLFFFKILGLFGLHLTGTAREKAEFIKYLLICVVIFVIYYKNIRSGKTRFKRGFLNNFIYSVACFVFLIIITILLHQFLNYIGNSRGISVSYGFTNYFTKQFTLSFALNLITECAFIPFLLCVIFPLGFSNIIKRSGTASIVAGLVYGIIYAISLNTSFEYALFHALTPACIIMLLTYLYKTNQNIWSVIITYAFYVLFGIFAINYIL